MMTPFRRPTWTGLLLLLLGAHVLLGAVRLPGKVWARRLDEIANYRSRGAAAFFLADAHHRGAEVVEWLLAHSPPAAIVLWRGDSKGALEFVPALIAPRLLVRDDACTRDADRYLDRPLARLRTTNGAKGPVLVIVGRGDDLILEAR